MTPGVVQTLERKTIYKLIDDVTQNSVSCICAKHGRHVNRMTIWSLVFTFIFINLFDAAIQSD